MGTLVLGGFSVFVPNYWKIRKNPRRKLLNKRTKYKRNYFFSLHVWAGLAAFFQYGSNLFGLPIQFTITTNYVPFMTTLGFIVLFAGFFLVVWGRLYLNSFWGTHIYKYENELATNYKLVTSKPYKICRHPIYFGQSCMVIGTALIFNNWAHVVLAILLIVVNIFRAIQEEIFLKETFTDNWEKYKNETPFFFPIG